MDWIRNVGGGTRQCVMGRVKDIGRPSRTTTTPKDLHPMHLATPKAQQTFCSLFVLPQKHQLYSATSLLDVDGHFGYYLFCLNLHEKGK